jgi:hypothetical protein
MPGYDEYEWAQLVAVPGGTLAMLTMDDLKVYLIHHGLKKSGTKAVLVERIQAHYAGQ